jgi:hypothetical protein
MKGKTMILLFFIGLILIASFDIPLDEFQFDASALYTVEASPKAYAERYLTFKNWMKSSNDQRKMLISGYLRLLELETGNLPQISEADQSWAREILGDTSHEELVPYINQHHGVSKKALRASGGGVETIVFQYVKNRLEIKKNYLDLLKVARHVIKVKNGDSSVAAGSSKYDVPEDPIKRNNISEGPKYRFSYDGWQCQTQNEKINLITGYVAFINILIKEDFCLDEEERRRYDLFCKLVTINDLVDHVDSLYKDPLYRDEGAQMLIYRYMTYNFQNYIGDPLMLPA